jgi:hypothetical protein
MGATPAGDWVVALEVLNEGGTVAPTILVGVLSWVNSTTESRYQLERFRVTWLRDCGALFSSNLAFQICCGSATVRGSLSFEYKFHTGHVSGSSLLASSFLHTRTPPGYRWLSDRCRVRDWLNLFERGAHRVLTSQHASLGPIIQTPGICNTHSAPSCRTSYLTMW